MINKNNSNSMQIENESLTKNGETTVDFDDIMNARM